MRSEPLIPLMKPEEAMVLLGPDNQYSRNILLLTKTEEWNHLAAARFGPSRPCSFDKSIRWTGDSYRYDIFQHQDRSRFGLRWSHAESGWLIEFNRSNGDSKPLLAHIASIPNEQERWDYCHLLAQSIERIDRHATAEEALRWKDAILNKAVRIQRKQGRRHVLILEPRQTEQ